MIFERSRAYRKAKSEIAFYMDKARVEDDQNKRHRLYQIAYRTLCRLESQYPMYINKLRNVRDDLVELLRRRK